MNKLIMCHWGHTRRVEDGEGTRLCPECIARRIRWRVKLEMPITDLLELHAVARRCETTTPTASC